MNCEECKEQLSAFMESDLADEKASLIREHLAVCDGCLTVCEDISTIVISSAEVAENELAPPNANAMWCRINNIIESEIANEIQKPVEQPKRRFWQLSLPQLASAIIAIAIVSSLLTFVVIQQYSTPRVEDFALRSNASQTTVEKLMSKIGLIDTPQQARDRRVKEQQAAITYWDNRVQTRRVAWDARTRDAFDRNLKVIDQSLNEYIVILAQDPDDELSGEMLDSVLNDKMNFLRNFSDL